MHEFQGKNMIRLYNQDSSLGDALFIETPDCPYKGPEISDAETARDRNIENGPISQTRKSVDE